MKLRNRFFFVLSLLLVLSVSAQNRPQSEKQVNNEYRNTIKDFIQQDVLKRQKQMDRSAEQYLVNLPFDDKLYDETFISIRSSVEECSSDEGKTELNYLFEISYGCHNIEGVSDDYSLGSYTWESSNSCKAICMLTKQMIEGICKDIFRPGCTVDITIHSTTDGTDISHINYGGEYGEYRYCPAMFNGENVRLSVSQNEGINSNAQLAYIRAQGVRYFLENNISNLKSTHNNFRYVTKSYHDTGSYYRRSSISMVVHGAFDKKASEMEASMRQDEFVDFNIPEVEANSNSETFVIIIANEGYNTLPNVPFATNDGNIMAQYCNKTLGIPERHIKILSDVSKQMIKQQGVEWLKDITVAVKGQANIIVYYAGHGMTDGEYKPYIIPNRVDFSDIKSLKNNMIGEHKITLSRKEAKKMIEQCLPIDTLAAWFNKVQCKNITFLLDASFNGVQRNGAPLFDITKTGRKGKGLRIRNDIVVFSAADFDKTAYSFDDQHHGFFTYFLLKELKRTKGDITYKELFDNIDQALGYESSLQGKLQQPFVTAGGKIKEGWEDFKF